MRISVANHSVKNWATAILLLSTLVFAGWINLKDSSSAADIRNFDPGNLMSDAVMSDTSTMSVQDIQSFLNSKNYCDNRNVHMAAWYPHLQYNIKDGRFVCMARESFDGKSAAQLIWEAAQEYNINPQVLIVLLEKEQGLVSDTWPNHVQYRTATGYGCPDTAPCDTQYYGMKNQLRLAAKLFREVLDGGWSNYPVGHRYVQYHPNTACGGSTINIQNRATSALYRYTPYQPNQAALNAGYGTGNDCSAYGNRNFWRLFTDWFDSTQSINYISLENQRWMQVRVSTVKVNLHNGEPAGETLSEKRQIKFIDKAFINNQWYLRTEYNHKDGGDFGIPLSDLSEIPFEPMTPEWKIINHDGVHRYVPNNERWLIEDGNLPLGTVINVTSKITVNGITSYRTRYNTENNQNAAFREERLDNLDYVQPLDSPREMTALRDTTMVNLNGSSCKTLPQYTPLHIEGKFIFNGVLHFTQSQSPIDPEQLCYIRSNDLNWDPIKFDPFEDPRDMQLNQVVDRINLETGAVVDRLPGGSIIHFSSKVVHNNQLYYRTTHNTNMNGPFGILARSVSEVR